MLGRYPIFLHETAPTASFLMRDTRGQTRQNVLATEVHRGYLLALVAEFEADGQPRFAVDRLLLRLERPGCRAAQRRRIPAGQLSIPRLSVRMPVSVHAVDTCLSTLVLEPVQLLDVAAIGGNQAAAAGQRLRFPEEPALRGGADRDLARPLALAPAGPEDELVAPVRPRGPDLDRFRPAQPERGLQLER